MAREKIYKNLPNHVVIIPDGNRRWAKKHGLAPIEGHRKGLEAAMKVVRESRNLGVKILTLWGFSTENWSRPKEEVDALMGLLVQAISDETDELKKSNVRLQVIGDVKSLPLNVQEKLAWSIDKLSASTGLTLVLALSYSSKWEIVEAVKRIAEQVKLGKLEPSDIDYDLMNCYLNTSEMPDPELLIRTSGECRISNFLLWQIAYAELYFTPKLWPDFRKEDLFEAIYDFQNRERRFGKTSQQLVS